MNAKFSPDKKYPTISIHASNQDDRFKLLEFTNTKLNNDVVPWIHSYGGEYNLKPGHDYILFGWMDKSKLVKDTDMNLRTDEIGQAESTLIELHKSLKTKLKDSEHEYSVARQEETRLMRIVENQKKELKAIEAAYREITGKEL